MANRNRRRQDEIAAENARRQVWVLIDRGFVSMGDERGEHAERWLRTHAPELPPLFERESTMVFAARVGRTTSDVRPTLVAEGYWCPRWAFDLHVAMATEHERKDGGFLYNRPWRDGFLHIVAACLKDASFRDAVLAVARMGGRDAVHALYLAHMGVT